MSLKCHRKGSDFKLSDAQELIASKFGFENWPALIKGIETMSASTASNANTSIIMAAEPQLFVSDIEAACRFYVHTLGFKTAFPMGNRRTMPKSSATPLA